MVKNSFPQEFLDQYGLVLPGLSDKSSDNGILFTSIAKILGFDFPNYKELVRSCYLKEGLVARWPGNDYDQAAWDDYLGIAACCIQFDIKDIPREILKYGLTHLFVFNTDNKLEAKDFLGRNITIWPLMFCAAFPLLKYILFPILYFIQLFFKKPNSNDASGTQLQWLYLHACKELGFIFKKLKEHEATLPFWFFIYYPSDHPFNNRGLS